MPHDKPEVANYLATSLCARLDTIMLLAIAAFSGFFLESIFGFGGTVIFLGLAGFFFDFKTLIYISMFVAIVSSLTIIFQQYKHISLFHLKRIFLFTLPGVIMGTFLIDYLASAYLLKFFALVLVVYGIKDLLFPTFTLPSYLKLGFTGLGGLIQGIFTTGGPFILMGYRDFFENKQQIRATMAVFFCTTNLLRITQNTLTTGDALPIIYQHLYLGFAVIIAVILGYFVHVRINEALFKKAMTTGITLIGFVLLFR